MTVKQEIMEAVAQFPGLTDTELEKRYHRSHQTINIACRELVAQGYLERRPNPDKDNLLGNYPSGAAPVIQVRQKPTNDGEMDEDTVKSCIKDWLESDGWTVRVAWEQTHGVDIEAVKSDARWLIEVKGPGSRDAMRHNYFLGILGETLQRMSDDRARYSIAFPDMKVYRNLWDRFPKLAKQRTGIDMILVDENGKIEILK